MPISLLQSLSSLYNFSKMPSKLSCARCGRRIEDGLENRVNGRVYGPECAAKVANAMNTPSIQEEAFQFCVVCRSLEGTEHKFWCTKRP